LSYTSLSLLLNVEREYQSKTVNVDKFFNRLRNVIFTILIHIETVEKGVIFNIFNKNVERITMLKKNSNQVKKVKLNLTLANVFDNHIYHICDRMVSVNLFFNLINSVNNG